MHSVAERTLLRWHGFLCLSRHPQPWYKDRLREEIRERRLAMTPLQKLSETADVFYIISRAQHDGHPLRRLPDFALPHLVVYAYLLSKYTSRWQFYRTAAFLCDHSEPSSISEVVNPNKDHKVQEVACRHAIDPASFTRVCRRLRMVWPLLP
ncbi:uncharacterized protein NECHADRAFT_55110 [Fusarium vanettenii 77-13-4]|uniref:Uncharacterized protein n=1 Tax=Fusarium vanettenii (strain ATCC MYA-4622 / CBS 123669 / FGSC 9596 / NRRL 45880 / 77-13-4) TaxID=660122 RepID=C7ZME5_FUSV7|nr:uncharacterized protein NECHADRAFT_55110 [Fusarium vanettenii 77-13-4]EEU34816.1 hypothetical protein NECHADRAFT_55110 [Fusarium vanettenii 77-13-4]